MRVPVRGETRAKDVRCTMTANRITLKVLQMDGSDEVEELACGNLHQQIIADDSTWMMDAGTPGGGVNVIPLELHNGSSVLSICTCIR